ncbi:MAG: RHS repeat domain-containing protein [Akkermansiaceae bacterium]
MDDILSRVVSTDGASLDVWYEYDGLTRRTLKRILLGNHQGTVAFYYNSAWKCIEQRKAGTSGATEQFVYGVRGRNDLILRDRDTSGNGTMDERLYALCDAMGSKTAVTDTAGAIKERYAYTAFGQSRVMAADYSAKASSQYDWQMRFHGETRDHETGYYNYGYRYYDTVVGRFINRDPIGERGGLNVYAFVRNDGIGKVDYLGLQMTRYRSGSAKIDRTGAWLRRVEGGRTTGSWETSLKFDGSRKSGHCWLLKVSGKLYVEIIIDPNSTVIDNNGYGPEKHERQHEEIHAINWNNAKKDIDPVEGYYCSKECADLAKSWAQWIYSWHSQNAERGNKLFDHHAYGNRLGRDDYNSLVNDHNAAVRAMNESLRQIKIHKKKLNELKCRVYTKCPL